MGAFYELQVFRHQAWKVDSVFDDKELAINAARRIETSGNLPVRVIEEKKDPDSGRAALRAVYRSGQGQPSATSGGVSARIENVERRVQTYVSDARRRRKGISFGTVAFNLLLVAALVGSGFVVVYFVHDYLNKVMP
jgi:hypothetical protein